MHSSSLQGISKRRCIRLRYCDDNSPAISNLLEDADNQLFRSILTNTEHNTPSQYSRAH